MLCNGCRNCNCVAEIAIVFDLKNKTYYPEFVRTLVLENENTDKGETKMDERKPGMIHYKGLRALIGQCGQNADEIQILSGYVSANEIELLRTNLPGKRISILAGMYLYAGRQNDMSRLYRSAENNSVDIRFSKQRIHSKNYLFLRGGIVFRAFAGSANLSDDGIGDETGGEDLTEIAADSYWHIIRHFREKWEGALTYDQAMDRLVTDPKRTSKVIDPYTTDLSLVVLINGQRTVPCRSGINWGLQKGHSKQSGAVEAYLPVRAANIRCNMTIIPPIQQIRLQDAGKKTRKNDSQLVIWDDGAEMQMIFSGTGVRYNNRWYPKQLTSCDGGGAVLGAYLRRRLGLNDRALVTVDDLDRYGRDTVRLTMIQYGIYSADFSI